MDGDSVWSKSLGELFGDHDLGTLGVGVGDHAIVGAFLTLQCAQIESSGIHASRADMNDA